MGPKHTKRGGELIFEVPDADGDGYTFRFYDDQEYEEIFVQTGRVTFVGKWKVHSEQVYVSGFAQEWDECLPSCNEAYKCYLAKMIVG